MVRDDKTRVAGYFTLLLLLIILLSKCGFPETYSGVSWNTLLNIPLLNKIYPVIDLEDGSNIIIEDDQIYLVYREELESDEVAAELKISAKSSELVMISSIETGSFISIPIDEIDEIDLIYGIIEEGFIKVEVIEPRPELDELNITFLNIFDLEGNPFNTVIEDFENSIHSFDISGYSVGEVGAEEVINELDFFIQTSSQQQFDDLAYIRLFYDDSIYFQYFRGYLNEKEIELHDEVINNDVNMPSNLSNALQLEEAVLELTFTNELGFDAKFIGTLTGINDKDNNESTLQLTEDDNVVFLGAEDIDTPKTTTVVIDKPELADFINVFPEQIIIENSSFILGNIDLTPGFAKATDKNRGVFSLTISSVFSLSNETVVPDTVLTIEISKKNREYIEEYLEEVSLTMILENTLPVGAMVDLYFSESADTLHIFNPGDNPEIQTILFSGNKVSSTISDNEPMIMEIELSMEREDLELFLREKIYFALKINFDESNGSVTILPDHYLKVLGRINVNINVDL
jgi:hypothetical protein